MVKVRGRGEPVIAVVTGNTGARNNCDHSLGIDFNDALRPIIGHEYAAVRTDRKVPRNIELTFGGGDGIRSESVYAGAGETGDFVIAGVGGTRAAAGVALAAVAVTEHAALHVIGVVSIQCPAAQKTVSAASDFDTVLAVDEDFTPRGHRNGGVGGGVSPGVLKIVAGRVVNAVVNIGHADRGGGAGEAPAERIASVPNEAVGGVRLHGKALNQTGHARRHDVDFHTLGLRRYGRAH